MLKRLFISTLVACLHITGMWASIAVDGYSVEGRVVEADGQSPVAGAAVRIGTDYLWAVTDADGYFSFRNVQKGEHEIEASCLGYVSSMMTRWW